MHALLVIDIQNDFLPGGALAVPDGDQVIAVANQQMEQFELVVATQDWHPQNHKSFASNHVGKNVYDVISLNGTDQVMWPDHCVQGTTGAEFAELLDTEKFDAVFHKGTNPEVDSYSGFFDNDQKSQTGLNEYLQSKKVVEVSILGLATDYCVNFTAMDARRLNYKTNLILSGCRGVNLGESDCDLAIQSMQKAGVQVV